MLDFTGKILRETGPSIQDQWLDLKLSARFRFFRARPGYLESTESAAVSNWKESLSPPNQVWASMLEAKYETSTWKDFLSLVHYRQNISTLAMLDTIIEEIKLDQRQVTAAEFGAYTFSRAPSILKVLDRNFASATLAGYELNPFPGLFSLHSVYDIARHICRNVERTRYAQADYRFLNSANDIIFAFYPFVSKDPTIAWGLPSRYGSAIQFRASVERNLKPGGRAVILHQGDWEQEEFNNALTSGPKNSLERIHGPKEISCPFLPTEHPAVLSVYTKN